MREDQLRGKKWRKNDALSIKSELLVKGIQEHFSVQALQHFSPMADSRCLLLHINLGRQNTVPCGALRCSAQKKNVAFDACQSKPAAACRQLPRHGWATERKMGAVVGAPWHQPCSRLDALQAFSRWKLLRGRQFCKYAEAGFQRASSTDRNAPHKLAFPRVWVDFAAQNLFQRGFVMLFWLFP